jgi:hypothetical protein
MFQEHRNILYSSSLFLSTIYLTILLIRQKKRLKLKTPVFGNMQMEWEYIFLLTSMNKAKLQSGL